MIILFIILAIIFAFFVALFFIKIRLIIDTKEGVFEVGQGIIYKVNTTIDPENQVKLKIRFLGIPFSVDLSKTNRKKKTERKRKPQKGNYRIGNIFKTILKSIKIKYLYISFDSGDFAFNAQLFPVVHILNYNLDNRYWFEVNFIGENFLKMRLESRPVWVVIAFIKLKLNQTKINKNGI